MFRIFTICVCVCALILMIIVAFIFIFHVILERKVTELKHPKIKFKDFKAWFLLCPEAYTLKDNTIHRFGLEDFRFGIIDTIRYKFWRKRESYRHAKEKNTEQIHMLLSYVKHDIEEYEIKTRKEIERLG